MFVERVEEISYREPVIWPHGAIQRMIVVWAKSIPRSAIISTRSRRLSLNRKYQRIRG
jgi:hypothetical protein